MAIRLAATGRAAAAGLALLGLGACASQDADDVAVARTVLVGMPTSTLLSCAGVPDRQATVDSRDFFTYSSERLVSRVVPSPSRGPYWHPWYGWSYPWAWDDNDVEVNTRKCEATFTLKDGVVQQVSFNPVGGSGSLSQCRAIVQNCLSLVPGRKS